MASDTHSIDYLENPFGWQDKKAPMQLTFATKKAMERAKPNVGDGSMYNIYWHKWYSSTTATRDQKSADNIPLTKLDPVKDSGRTRGSELHLDDGLFCIHFARGACAKGPDCTYLHRIPIPSDERRLDRTRDIFGRERHRLDRDDMGGTGSFERDNCTLYVGKMGVYEDMESTLRKHFELYGEIEAVKVVAARNTGFIKYKSRLSAEFAKVAMNEQSLEHGECLNVRWASEDVNANSLAETKQEADAKMLQVISKIPAYTQNLGVFYENQTEDDLNRYYQQGNLDYAGYFSNTTGGGNAIPNILTDDNNQSEIVKTIATPTQAVEKVPPPPPPRKRKAQPVIDETDEQAPSKRV